MSFLNKLIRKEVKQKKNKNFQQSAEMRAEHQQSLKGIPYQQVISADARKYLEQAVKLETEANFLQDEGYHNLAVRKYQQSAAIRKKIFQQQDMDDSYIFYNLASSLIALKQEKEALISLRKALAIVTKESTSHISMLFSIYKNGFAKIFLSNRKVDEALYYLIKSVALPSLSSNVDLQDIAKTHTKIAALYEQKKDYPCAITYYQNALKLYKAADRINYRALYKLYVKIGNIQSQLGKTLEAIQSFERATILYNNLPQENIKGIRLYLIYLFLAHLYKKLNYYWFPLFYVEKALKNIQQSQLAIDPDTVRFYKEVAIFYHDLKYYEEAAFYLEKYIILSKQKSSISENVKNLLLLGDVYITLKRYVDALSSFKDAYVLVDSTKNSSTELCKKIKERIRVARMHQKFSTDFQFFSRYKYQKVLSINYIGDNLSVILSTITFLSCYIASLLFCRNRAEGTRYMTWIIVAGIWLWLGIVEVYNKKTSGTIELTKSYIAFPETIICRKNLVSKWLQVAFNSLIAPFFFPLLSRPKQTQVSYQEIEKVYFLKKYVINNSNKFIPIVVVYISIISKNQLKLVSFSTLNIGYNKMTSFINLLELLGIKYSWQE
ncbi:MAG: tetratricopeptide repeat protein [Bacteroidota bacterium]